MTDLDPGTLAVLDVGLREDGGCSGRHELPARDLLRRLGGALPAVLRLPVRAVHLDLVRGPDQLDEAVKLASPNQMLSLGLIDGRNIWRTDLLAALNVLDQTVGATRCRSRADCTVLLAAPCPLRPRRRDRARFRVAKLVGVRPPKARRGGRPCSRRGAGTESVADELEENRVAMVSRRTSPRTMDPAVRRRLAEVSPTMLSRGHPYDGRRASQRARTPLPLLPTTTIGSFPQTEDVRKARAAHRSGKLPAGQYETFLRAQVADAVRWQEEIGLDVLVHGEFERNDMVEYFGENLDGFAFTANGWVQSYGSRCVKPPLIYGDVKRRGPMTVEWARYAQSLTSRPVKGMLTGPVTILQWSFVRDDQPRRDTCWQIALAIRDEVADLESAGIAVIQVDEPALREGLPLRRAEWESYLRWAVDAFRLASSGVRDETQMHTHMCYCEFNDIIDSIAAMDADVISIETSRSQMELLGAFARFRYPNEVGPGVYDIHSPRVPTQAEVKQLLEKALSVLSPEQLWVNPDCGLKTRRWEEVRPALTILVEAAREMRRRLAEMPVRNGGVE